MHLRPLHFLSRPSALSLPAVRKLRGTVAEQCCRKEPAFSDLRAQTLFHRFQILFFVRRSFILNLSAINLSAHPESNSTQLNVLPGFLTSWLPYKFFLSASQRLCGSIHRAPPLELLALAP